MNDPADALRARLEQLDAEIAERAEERERVERALAVLVESDKQRLTPGKVTGNKTGTMLSVARIKRSRSATDNDPCAVAANAKGFTMADLARTLEITPQYLSMLRHGHRNISAAMAGRIQELTGFAASKKNWPKLRS